MAIQGLKKMKFLIVIFCALSLILYSCGPSAEEKEAMAKCLADEILTERAIRGNLKNTFDTPFPKRNIKLSRVLGDTFQIIGRCGWWNILTYKIVSTRKSNQIINIETGEILFKGIVCRYRGLYYFNEQLNDTSFRIFALKITDSLVYGLQNYFQYHQIDSVIESGSHSKLVKFVDKSKNVIRLHPDKKELRKLFTPIIANTEPFVLIPSKSTTLTEDLADPITPEDFEILSKVYPNPTIDILNVDLQQNTAASPYYLSDINGKVVLQGQFREISNKMDVGHLSNGVYALTVVTTDSPKETVKVIKIN